MRDTKSDRVSVFGILNIVMAVFGIVSLTTMFFLLLPQAAATNNPVVQLIHDNAAYAAWIKLSLAMGLVATVAKLVAGIGLLKLKPWGRQRSIICAIML